MTKEIWREACEKLRSEGVKFKCCYKRPGEKFRFDFINDQPLYFEILEQPIPARPDWREWCYMLRQAGVKFEFRCDVMKEDWWSQDIFDFDLPCIHFRIAHQPIPQNIGEIMENLPDEVKAMPQDFNELMAQSVPIDKAQIDRVNELVKDVPEQEEIPHRELQIQYLEDWIKYFQGIGGKPVWQARYDGDWEDLSDNYFPGWRDDCQYRRKPKVKKKIVVADWFVQSQFGDVTRYRCKSCEELRSLFPYANTIQKIDGTEQEIKVDE